MILKTPLPMVVTHHKAQDQVSRSQARHAYSYHEVGTLVHVKDRKSNSTLAFNVYTQLMIAKLQAGVLALVDPVVRFI
jgi:hypothetical protein